MLGKLVGIIIVVLDILAIVDCAKSSKSTGKKALWIAVIILIQPAIGLILYYLIGKKK